MAGFTIEDLEAIEDAIKSGALEVEYNDRRVKFRSKNELVDLHHFISKKLGLKKRSARILCKTKKGTC